MNARTVVLALVAAIWWYGWLRIVVEFTLAAAAVFFGTMFFFALYDAIRTRNDPRPGTRRPRDDEDEELRQLRRMAGV
jgi:hypothetical protein